MLHVSGERKTAGTESKFVRSFSIDPNTVDFDNMKANLEYGVLTLTAPKRVKPAISKAITRHGCWSRSSVWVEEPSNTGVAKGIWANGNLNRETKKSASPKKEGIVLGVNSGR
jgi:Hsp20/alpha crystallin family